jgi:hypothetical protein
MDEGARKLILGVTQGVVATHVMVAEFFADQYGSWDDYFAAVAEVWGSETSWNVRSGVEGARAETMNDMVIRTTEQVTDKVGEGLFLAMPEPDFRSAVFESVRTRGRVPDTAERITRICQNRGIPWELDWREGFRWVGDREIESLAVRPALSAIEDPRFAGVKSEFDQARKELALGTPEALKQCVHESACAVESAMRVLLIQRGETPDERDAASKLFERLAEAGIVPRPMEKVILGAATPRNKRAGHGAGEQPHEIPPGMAEAVLASAAVAVAYLHAQLPAIE